jgi:hypothetical protein
MFMEDDTMVGFEPPSLSSLRCDMMIKVGELENVPRPSRDWNKEEPEEDKSGAMEKPPSSTNSEASSSTPETSEPSKVEATVREAGEDSDPRPIRDSLSL